MKSLWTILLFITYTYGQYKIETLTNPILPIVQGTSFIVTGNHHAYYHVNLTKIKTCVRQIKTTLLNINHTITNITTPFKELLLTRTKNLLNQVLVQEQFLRHYTITKRHKRGLINVIGTIDKYLFGTLDASDGERYDNYIKILQTNQEILQHDTMATQTILKNISKSFDKTITKIKTNQDNILTMMGNLSVTMSMTTLTTHFILTMDNIESNLRIISDLCNNIQTAINFAETGTLHHSIIKITDLNKIILQINPKARIPFDNIIKYYETAHADVLIKNSLIIFHVAIPLISDIPYTLYHLFAIPIQNHIVSIKNPFLLLNKNDYFNTPENCIKIEEIILCSKFNLNKDEKCIVQTINAEFDHCPMIPILYNQTSVRQLQDNSIIIIPALEERISLFCPKQNSIEIVKEPSIIFPKTCKVNVKNEHYESQKINVINLRLKLPSIKINTGLFQQNKPVKLKSINLETLHNDIKAVDSLSIHPLHSFNIGEGISILTIIIICIVFVTLGIYMYFKYIKKDDVKMSIKLDPLENATPFSHT
ncbi:uncharacterized protein LOC143195792 [Rhynchophorus ferrugineus]|uniref:uncharacterized protein LOC143195792 n=1 Tax=Rhynchophorus ferrugineus TaxID=354439 RepID=UPI003FCCE2B8